MDHCRQISPASALFPAGVVGHRGAEYRERATPPPEPNHVRTRLERTPLGSVQVAGRLQKTPRRNLCRRCARRGPRQSLEDSLQLRGVALQGGGENEAPAVEKCGVARDFLLDRRQCPLQAAALALARAWPARWSSALPDGGRAATRGLRAGAGTRSGRACAAVQRRRAPERTPSASRHLGVTIGRRALEGRDVGALGGDGAAKRAGLVRTGAGDFAWQLVEVVPRAPPIHSSQSSGLGLHESRHRRAAFLLDPHGRRWWQRVHATP
mmetsp:Transcript_49364/g.138839  ORF Transcript_49364/g.138839 Transcript_49364/m.138839 type:complete len:267 (+) Transcript_49364:730-1530(+)